MYTGRLLGACVRYDGTLARKRTEVLQIKFDVARALEGKSLDSNLINSLFAHCRLANLRAHAGGGALASRSWRQPDARQQRRASDRVTLLLAFYAPAPYAYSRRPNEGALLRE